MAEREISGERVRQRREELDLSQKQLADAVGVTQQSIQIIERGGVRKPRFIAELADALQTSIGMLLKDFPTTMPENLDANNIDLFENLKTQYEGVQIAGYVESGTFRRADLYPQAAVKRVSLSIDRRYAAVPQYAWEVRGDAMNDAGITDGMFVLAGMFDNFVREYNSLKDETIVIVERYRNSRKEIETSIKQLEYLERGAALRSKSGELAHEDFILPDLENKLVKPKQNITATAGGRRRLEQIEIIAVVLSAHRLLSP